MGGGMPEVGRLTVPLVTIVLNLDATFFPKPQDLLV